MEAKRSKVTNTKKRKKSKVISFDDEVVTKDQAAGLLSAIKEKEQHKAKHIDESLNLIYTKNKFKNNKEGTSQTCEQTRSEKRKNSSNKTSDSLTSSAKQKKSEHISEENASDSNITPEEKSEGKKEKPSVRSHKKQKHAKLLEETKLKAELSFQQGVLNYLSKWKQSRSEWKFEKLKQIWINDHLFDASKIPSEFWETTVQYFNGSKGQTRKLVLEKAISIVEKEDSENTNENYQIKLSRARDIVQNMQE